ncbi:hypothetical protein FNF31_03824 [Cafeteria roenbergensis]|uniref:histidine kinase n=1 Tax=Cafeteria roenbergensis TaxID=33653 RepID=A0A5A8D7Z6_CAFRO|nr:hypothetical protein FNF31_03824 [Cafeteria roenbergensis]KAA0161760.1 hypothetical protein FNF28_04947 [Cafeteria roenbergensis]
MPPTRVAAHSGSRPTEPDADAGVSSSENRDLTSAVASNDSQSAVDYGSRRFDGSAPGCDASEASLYSRAESRAAKRPSAEARALAQRRGVKSPAELLLADDSAGTSAGSGTYPLSGESGGCFQAPHTAPEDHGRTSQRRSGAGSALLPEKEWSGSGKAPPTAATSPLTGAPAAGASPATLSSLRLAGPVQPARRPPVVAADRKAAVGMDDARALDDCGGQGAPGRPSAADQQPGPRDSPAAGEQEQAGTTAARSQPGRSRSTRLSGGSAKSGVESAAETASSDAESQQHSHRPRSSVTGAATAPAQDRGERRRRRAEARAQRSSRGSGRARPGDSGLSSRKPRAKPAAGHTVLVVEDVPVNRLLLARACASSGATVAEAADGQQGLAQLRAIAARTLRLAAEAEESGRAAGAPWASGVPSGCSLVVLDRDMPVMDGFGFLDALLRYRTSSDPVERAMSSVRVEGCTGNAVDEIREGFMRRGAVGVMTKPVHRETIVAAVLRAVKSAERHGASAASMAKREGKS